MLLIYYIVAFLMSFFCWIFFIFLGQKKTNTNLGMLFTVSAISNGGYLALALADTLEVAILAQKVVYIAAIFAPMFILFNICALCKINLPRLVRIIVVILCAITYSLILTVGYSKIYYEKVTLHKLESISYITKVYGSAHLLYTFVLYGLVLASYCVVIYAFLRQRKVSYKNSVVLIILLTVSVIVYTAKKITGISIELMPIFYSVLVVLLFILYRREDMYDINYAILNTIEQEKYGYIVFDKKLNYIGSNGVANIYNPYLKDLKIDRPIEKDKVLFGQIRKKVEKLKNESFVTWNKRINGINLKCELRNVYYDNAKVGYLLELTDDTEQQKYIKRINNYNAELEGAIDKQIEDILEIQNKIILGIANVVESRDNSTGGHIKRTSEVVKIFVDKLRHSDLRYDCSDEFYNDLIKAAPMHDLGKIAIDDRILRKPGRFTPEEYKEMQKHAKEGALIIDSVLEGVEDESFVHVAKNVANYHHEKYDGTGYPDKLSGENIPLEARIMALADVFDALVSKRCYKEKFTFDEAFSIIEESIGSHFDPELGKIFINCREQLEVYYNKVGDDE